jgi:VWFA-related protein
MRPLPTLVLAAVALTLQTSAQQPATTTTKTSDISVDARLVVVPTVIRDKKNNLVTNLKKDDFVLQVDGQPQPVRYFDHDSDVPLTVGLLVDTSMSQRSVLDDERSASSTFLDKMLAPDRDKAFVIQFAHSVDLLQDITPSRPKLQEALKQLDSERPSFNSGNNDDNNNSSGGYGGGGYGGRDHHDRGQGGGTALYDAVFLASDEVLAKQKGRLALILLTDGDDRGSKVTLARSIEAAQRANAIVYAIYYKGEHPQDHGPRGFGFPGGGGHHGGGFPLTSDFAGQRGGYGQDQVDGKKILERICGETGGRVYEVSKKLTVEAIYTQIAEELRTQYRLGFSPTAEAASEGYHQITLSLTGEAAKAKPVIQTRDGYYTGAGK